MVTAADKQKAAKVPVWQGVLEYFPTALHAVGAVSKFGAGKHNGGNFPTGWRNYPVEAYGNALARHILDENNGDIYDSESHLLHAAHEAWNALARLELLLTTEPLQEAEEEIKQQHITPVLFNAFCQDPSCVICRRLPLSEVSGGNINGQ